MALAAAAPAPGPGGAGPTADLAQPGEVERLRERLRSREAELAALRLRTAALDHEQEELAARARALEAARRAREVEVGEQAALLRERAAELAALRQRATQAEGERDALTAHVHAQAERLRHREAELVALRRQLAMPSACEECRALRGERDGLRARVRELEQAWDAVMRAFGGRPAAAPAAPPVAQTEAAPPSRLVIVDHRRAGLAEGAAFALRPGMVVGRRAGADIELGDTCVSAEHARLTQEGGSWWATDLGTTNGTFVNGARIVRPTALSAGDEVRFGRVRARLAREPAPGTAGAAASGR
jgi:hypothetical protein